MAPALRLEAPAKINLGLRVVGRRADGYHEIESLFLPLALADEIELATEPAAGGPSPGPAIELSLTPIGRAGERDVVPADDSNLAVRAARAYFDAAPEAARALGRLRIRLRKRIPTAAGLGGGSSDAGAVLRGLSALVPGGPDARGLAAIALRLGADVSFFLAPVPSLVRGIGDRIEPIAGLPTLAILLANPGTSLSTADVYRVWDVLARTRPAGLTVPDPGPTMRALFGPGTDPTALSRLPGLHNDLEAAAIRLCPPVARLRDRIRASGALHAGMSGSGATVFGVFRSEADAERARAEAGFDAETWTCVTRSRRAL